MAEGTTPVECWCCQKGADDEGEPLCSCTVFQCLVHRDDDICLGCCRQVWGMH